MKPYANYKDSGVPWIGVIPEGWEARRIKFFCNIKRGASPRPIDDLKYFDENGERYWVRISDVTSSTKYLNECEGKLSPLGIEASVPINENDFFVSICASVGKPCISKVKACIHDGFVLFEELPQEMNNYMFYLFETGLLFAGLGNWGTQLNLNSDIIKNIYIPTHDKIPEITTYLDKQTSTIDTLISDKEKLLTLLAEERQAIISEAVTKGLDTHAEMKDSSVEWIGEIPVGWEVKKLTWLFNEIGSGTTPNHAKGNFYGGDTLWLNTGDLTDDYIYNVDKTVNDEALEKHSTLKIYEKNSLVIAMYGATIGKLGITTEPLCTNQACCVMAKPVGTSVKYMFYFFRAIRNHLISLGHGGGQPNISQSLIREIVIPLPLLEVQERIVQYLDEKTSKIDQITADTKEQIKLLKEYRQSLISEVVTGKVEV